MAETTINQFGSGVSMSCGFDLGAKTLMDSRCLVKDETELNAIPDIQRANGLLVWVQDETALYAWDAVSSSWIRNGAKGDKGDQGEKGEKGDTGAQGETGAKGDTGSAAHVMMTTTTDSDGTQHVYVKTWEGDDETAATTSPDLMATVNNVASAIEEIMSTYTASASTTSE